MIDADLVTARRLRRAAAPAIIAVALLCGYLAIRAFSIAHGYPLPGADIGTRDLIKGGIHCREYYRLKDGLPVRTVCPR
jgi:hypothetical protein